jgi:hypothetical protein
MLYCTDSDLLGFEPLLFRDAAFASQTLGGGTGDLAGTTFTRSAGSFTDEHVTAGGVIWLGDPLGGCFPIISVDAADTLTLSVNYGEAAEAPSPVGSAMGVAFAVRTFRPQLELAGTVIRALAGVGPGTTLPEAELLPSPQLRHATALGALELIYRALTTAAAEPAGPRRQAEMYERLFRRALCRLRVEIDTDGDGQADRARLLGMIRLART